MALQLRLARLEDNVLGHADRSLVPSIPEQFELRTPADVLQLLQWQIAAVAGDRRCSAVERARAIGYLGALSLRAIEANNIVARLEATLKHRARDENKSA
jgi:hypothetical protein